MEEPNDLRYVVAGMLSTIDFIPSQTHPQEMVGLADKIIHHVNIAGGLVPYESPEGPYEDPETRSYAIKDTPAERRST